LKFRTEININKPKVSFHINDTFLLFGSCFSTNIAEKLAYYKFNVQSNVFGTCFNPISIHRLLGNFDVEKHIVKQQNIYRNLDTHYSLGFESEAMLIQDFENKKQFVAQSIKNAQVLILTYGTSNVYV
jgi:hypothetical protein